VEATELAGPVERLHSHLNSVVQLLDGEDGATRRFVAAEHWRLSQFYPEEVALATKSFVDLLEVEIASATEQGLLHSKDPARDAWLLNQLVLSVFHHHSFASSTDPSLGDDLWRFTLRALGGDDATSGNAQPPKGVMVGEGGTQPRDVDEHNGP
jgi:TetR/AcrR family transcriptional regulator